MAAENSITINISDFSISPGPRYYEQGDASGEIFYVQVLKKAFEDATTRHAKLVVVLDGVDGYASSFLDEAFGNLVYDFGASKVRDALQLVSEEEPEWKDMIFNETVTNWEKRRKEHKSPKRTIPANS